MPTSMKAFALLAGEYDVDPEDTRAVEKFYTSEWPEITSRMTESERQELMDLLLSLDGVSDDDLPARIAMGNSPRGRSRRLRKGEFIEKVAERTGISRESAEEIVNAVFEAMRQSLIKGEQVDLRGLGSFTVKSVGAATRSRTKRGRSRGLRGLMTYEIREVSMDD